MTDSSLFPLSPLDAPATPGGAGRSAADGASPQSPSLYRKYRPQSFDAAELVGQEHVVNTLRNAIARGRIAHAYLFCGPRGTGKTTTARLLAKAVNCLDPDPRNRPCNACAACVAINRGATTDVIEIDAASNRGIDDIRDLRERVKYAPAQLKTKFYIIDEAHQITGAAANAFLKTLEEPPDHTKFVLATTDPEELLQTIVSRCQRFDFRRINVEAMTGRLAGVAKAESIEVDDEALQVIARHATGSLRDALGLLDQVAIYRDQDDTEQPAVTAELVRAVLGVSRNDRVESLVAAMADHDPAAGLRAIGEAVDAGEDVRQLGRQLVNYLRLLLLERAGGAADADERAKELARRFQLPELASLTRRFGDIDYRIKHASLAQLPLELAVVEACLRPSADAASKPLASSPHAAKDDISAPRAASAARHEAPGPARPAAPRPSLVDRVRGAPAPQARMIQEAPPRQPAPAPEPDPAPASASTAPPRPAERPGEQPTMEGAAGDGLGEIVDRWMRIRQDVKALNRRVEALLQQADPAAIRGDTVYLVSPYEFHRTKLNSDEARRIVEDVMSRHLDRRVQVSCVSRDEADRLRGSGTAGQNAANLAPSPVADIMANGAAPSANGAPAPDNGAFNSDDDDDEVTLRAAMNIFDAEPIDE